MSTKFNSELADYLAEHFEALTRWSVANPTGSLRIDSIDPNLAGLQVCVFYGSPAAKEQIDGIRSHNGTIEVIGGENEAFQMADQIYSFIEAAPTFNTAAVSFKRINLEGDVIRRGLIKPGVTNYGIEFTAQYRYI